MGNALGCADSAQARWQSNSTHNACSWLQQPKKKKRLKYLQKRQRRRGGEGKAGKKREIRFLNTRNLQKKFSPDNFLFSSFFLLTPTLRKCLGFKSNKYQPHKSLCIQRNPFSNQNLTYSVTNSRTVPLVFVSPAGQAKTILISISFFTFF